MNKEEFEALEKEEFGAFKKAAEKGCPKAQCELGYYYHHGEGVEKDPDKGAKWYKEAAEQGHLNAMFNLGLCCARGEGVKKDLN